MMCVLDAFTIYHPHRFVPLIQQRLLEVFTQTFLKSKNEHTHRTLIRLFNKWRPFYPRETVLKPISDRLKLPFFEKKYFIEADPQALEEYNQVCQKQSEKITDSPKAILQACLKSEQPGNTEGINPTNGYYNSSRQLGFGAHSTSYIYNSYKGIPYNNFNSYNPYYTSSQAYSYQVGSCEVNRIIDNAYYFSELQASNLTPSQPGAFQNLNEQIQGIVPTLRQNLNSSSQVPKPGGVSAEITGSHPKEPETQIPINVQAQKLNEETSFFKYVGDKFNQIHQNKKMTEDYEKYKHDAKQ